MRKWRQSHPLTESQRVKDIARSRVSVALSRGHLTRQPCEVCGSTDRLEAHHDDYDRPLDVRWFCRLHHLAHHRALVT